MTGVERAGERGREQRVRVGDVEHAVAADGEASGMAPVRTRLPLEGGQSRANPSPNPNSLLGGKIQGIH